MTHNISVKNNRTELMVLAGSIALVCLVVVIAHWKALSAEAVAFDDEQYLIYNERVKDPSFSNALKFLSEVKDPTTVRGYYQPLSMISLMLDTAIGGGEDNLSVYHRTSLALHVINTALVIIILYLLFGDGLIAAGAGLLFGTHPMTVDPVAWTSERKTLLAAVFVLLCLVLYIKYVQTAKRRFLAASLILFIPALLSKPTTTLLPVVLLLLDYWPLKRLNKKTCLEKIPFFIVAGISGWVTVISQRNTSMFVAPGAKEISEPILKVLCNIAFYPCKMIWPAGLTPHYPIPQPLALSNPAVLAAVIGACVIIIALIVSTKWTRAILTGALIFFVMVFPAMGVIGFSNVIASNKFAYLPSLGILLILVWIMKGVIKNRIVLLAVLIVVAGAQITVGQKYLAKWQDSETLWRHIVSNAPDNLGLRITMGSVYEKERKYKEALREYYYGLKIDPGRLDIINNVAWLYATSSDPKYRNGEKAVELAQKVCEVSGYKSAQALDTLAVAYAATGQFDMAVKYAEQALQNIQPRDEYMLRPQISERLGLFKEGKAFLAGCNAARVVTIAPTDANIQYHGRWNFSDPSIPWVYWQGSSIIVNFDGTGISLDIEVESNTEQYRIVIDGVPQPDRLYVTGRETKVLAGGLAPGIHTVQVMKETWEGKKTYFHGLEVTGTGLVGPPKRPALRIEFYGDSDMDGSSNYSEKNTGDMGTYYAFPAMITRMLGAEMNVQAVGGATIDDGGDDGNNDVRSFIFAQEYGKEDSSYRSGFDPHIIVVHASANDIGAGKKVIKKRYKNVIAELRKVYGSGVHIVLSCAYGYDLNEPSGYVDEVVEEVGGNLSACLFSWSWERWHGCQWEQSGMAHGLVEHITSLNPEWVKVKPNDIIDGFGHDFDVANGSFEHKAPFGGFGWRYMEDGVERIKDAGLAADGKYFIRLKDGKEVHQPIDATGDNLPGATTGDQAYKVTAMIRGTTLNAIAQINADFEEQALYNRTNGIERSFTVDSTWKEYSTSFAAPDGTWKTFVILRAKSGTVEFDNVRMSSQPVVCGDGICITNLECGCTEDCGMPPSTETSCTDGFDNDCDGDTDCADADCEGNPACRPMLSQSRWRVHSFSSHEAANNAIAAYAIDGHPGTIWHTQWSPDSPKHPHEIVIDLGGLCDIDGFKYLRRPADSGDNGTIADYEFYVGMDGSSWPKAIAKGTFENSNTEKEVNFAASVQGRYVRFVALSEVNGGPWASVAELNVFGNVIPTDGDGEN